MTEAFALDRLRVYVKSLRRSGRATLAVCVLRSLWQFGKNVKDFANAPRLLFGMKTACAEKGAVDLVDVVIGRFGGILRPLQNRCELIRLIKRVESLKPRVILEIGTAKGGTLFLLSKAADPNATIISVDLPGGMFGGGYPYWKKFLFHWLVGSEQSLHLIRGDSHDRWTTAKVEQLLGGRGVDVIFIDGDHSYTGVKQDFLQYRRLACPGGIVCFHDIVENRFDPDIEVARFWSEVKSVYEVEEIVGSPDEGNFGIGIVRTPDRWE